LERDETSLERDETSLERDETSLERDETSLERDEKGQVQPSIFLKNQEKSHFNAGMAQEPNFGNDLHADEFHISGFEKWDAKGIMYQ
jgi:hypothetical protein